MNSASTHGHSRRIKLLPALALAVFCTPSSTHAQNLVPNPGFEETDSCTFGLGLGALHHWYSAYLTPDHLQSCQPYGVANGLPLNILTFQQPFEGNSCGGIITYDGHTGQEQREWLMVPLLSTLVQGQTYYCSFRANAAYGGNGWNPVNWLASNNPGMLFTTYDRRWLWGDPYPAALNQAHILYPQILSDTVGWTLVSGSFVADSAYSYLMLGNFFSNALTDTLHLAPNVPEWGRFSYTLVDAVCVSPDPDGCERSQGMEELGAGVPFVYPNPASDVLVISNAAGRDAVVLDMLGKRVWSGRTQHDRFGLDVGAWARGAYVLQVHGARSVQVVKFVLAE
ncbi:MAG: T9SS type A sorting domain-containing protein [Flavobacteriales bacterium]|nr:MAG: T9SS type A sorting domain-containing protein [Flavobacteriales bacterium]